MPRSDDELLAAYVDGIAELTADERRRVEAVLANDASLRSDEAATRAVIGTLRELPPEGSEPDWAAMERAISAEVGPTVPRRWWQPAWRWLVPVTALATAVTIAVVWIRDPAPAQESAPTSEPTIARVIDAGLEPVVDDSTTIALWLDGQEIEVGFAAEELLEVDDGLLGEDESVVDGLLPTSDLAWVDELEDEDIEAAELWLARKRS